ncbi:MAG TPA: hypothetical protein DCQ29_02095 [Chitinophagaceae bacterium]|nr:hypothetical protein [Chitinophagaceae bacterium]
MANSEKISKILELKNLRVSTLEKLLGVGNSTLRKAVERNSSVSIEVLKKISSLYPDLSTDWLFYDKGEPIAVPSLVANPPNPKEKHILMRLALKENAKPIPVTNIKASAGAIQLYNDEPELIIEYIETPLITDAVGTIEVKGHSMAPKYPNGTRIVIGEKLTHKHLIRPGEDYYIIDLNYEGYIKRLYKVPGDDTKVELRSYNEDKDAYPNYQLNWSEVIAVFRVKAGIQLT